MTPLRLLHEGEGYVAVDKPAGLLVIPGRNPEGGPSARELLEAQLGRKVYVVHRLDRDTTGVLLFALTAKAHRTLSMAFEGGQVEKHYLAVVRGRLAEPRTIQVPLVPARRGRMRPAGPRDAGKPAVTLVRPLRLFQEATLVDAQPLTGRTHQIRVHLLSVGNPLWVDPQYGQAAELTERDVGGAGEAVLLSRTPLHAAELVLPKLEGLAAVTVRAPLPEDMQAVLARLEATAALGA